jgi:SAM-dependent methyltransferase
VSSLARDVSSYYEEILPFYRLETEGRPDLAFWRWICRREKPRRVLELGSGLGRVTAVLARGSPWVVGVDIALSLVARAQRRPGARRLHLAAADMRRLPFDSGFDLIAAPRDPLSHLIRREDRASALHSVARLLAPGGKFVLDGLYLPRAASRTRRHRVAVPAGTLSIEQSWQPLGRENRWRASYVYRLRRGTRTSGKRASFVARAWDPKEIGPFFRSCGLVVEETWGGLDADPFTLESPRIIVVARRSLARQGRTA